MKIIRSAYDYQIHADETRAGFKLKLIRLMWDKLKIKVDPNSYYEINRAIGDLVDEMILCVGSEFKAHQHPVFDKKFIRHEAKQRLAHGLVNEILKSDMFTVSYRETPWGEETYRVSVPFIKTTKEAQLSEEIKDESKGGE